MIYLTVQPSLDTLDRFISKISSFPISAGQLSVHASKTGEPSEVIDFYKSFASDRVFIDKEDLSCSSEQVELMREEGGQMPREEERSPEEY